MIVAISGGIASGKSTLARGIAETLRWRRAGFGQYVRQLAATEGCDPGDTRALQDLGNALVLKDVSDFCKGFLNFSGWKPDEPLVVDGLRHDSVAKVLRQLTYPNKFLVIFVRTDASIRTRRLRDRSMVNANLEMLDAHEIESEVLTEMAEKADIVVDGNQPPSAITSEAVSEIKKRTLLGLGMH